MDITLHPLVGIMHLLARLHPRPWHYQRDPDLLGWRPENIPALLSKLRAEGLVDKVAGTADSGPGVTLTAEGVRAAGDPGSLDRLARGVPVNGPEPSETASADRPPSPPAWAARGVVLVNVGVFLYGLWLASAASTAYGVAWLAGMAASVTVFLLIDGWVGKRSPWLSWLIRVGCVAAFAGGVYLAFQRPLASSYILGPMVRIDLNRYLGLLHAQGSVTAEDVLDGAWWRLVTSGLVHAGILSLVMIASSLWSSGAFIEHAFGWWRFLIIYLFGCLGGGCASMAHDPRSPLAGVGAWEASCGILGAMAVYALLHGRYLSREVTTSLWTSVITSALILGLLSFMAMRSGGGLSPWGLLGGAVGGAAAAAVMYAQRYGGLPIKVLALLALAPLAWGLFQYLQSTRQTSEKWEDIELDHVKAKVATKVEPLSLKVFKVYDAQVEKDLFERRPERRDPAALERAVKEMREGMEELKAEAERWRGQSRYQNAAAREAVAAAVDTLDEQVRYYGEALTYLTENKNVTRAAYADLEERYKPVLTARHAWEAALEGRPKRKKPD